MRKISEDMANSFWDYQPKKMNNSEVFINKDGEICLKLWDTIVARINNEGYLVLNNGGYLTTTTKSRINAVLQKLDCYVNQKAGVWYLHNTYGEKIPFENGKFETSGAVDIISINSNRYRLRFGQGAIGCLNDNIVNVVGTYVTWRLEVRGFPEAERTVDCIDLK
jgi:hypothetical protein